MGSLVPYLFQSSWKQQKSVSLVATRHLVGDVILSPHCLGEFRFISGLRHS